MLNFKTAYKNFEEQPAFTNISDNYHAAVLVFPYKANGTTTSVSGDDVIAQRMRASLSSNETSALLDMIKYRAKHLKQEIWVTTQMFLATMGVEEMDDLTRCDFVRAVEFLVRLEPAQTQSVN